MLISLQMLRQWERAGYGHHIYIVIANNLLFRQTKIALRCGSEDELLVIEAQAQSLNLCARSILDAYVYSHAHLKMILTIK